MEEMEVAQPTATGARIARATGAIMAFQVAGFAFGFITKLVIARFGGTGPASEAYFAAFSVAVGLFLVCEQLLTHSVLQPFVHVKKDRGEGEAWRLASLVANIQAIILLSAVTGGVLAAPFLVKVFAPGFSGQKLQDTIGLTRLIFPCIFLLSMGTLTYVLLNAYKQFAIPALGNAIAKGMVAVGAIALWGKLGPLSLVAGLGLGAVGKMAVHLLGLGRSLRFYRPFLSLHYPPGRKVVALMLPLLVGVVVGTLVRNWAETFFPSMSEGGVAALKFARALVDIPIQVFPYALGIAFFPFMTDLAAMGEFRRLGSFLMSAIRVVVFVFLPLTVAMILLAEPVVRIVFQRGEFTAASTAITVPPLVYYAIGLVFFAAEAVVLQVFFALSDTLTPTIWGIVMQGVYLGPPSWG